MAKAIMLQGTASGVGKTILTMALCRIFSDDGYSTAPFKAQNMTSNTIFTDEGEEIAVSQWLQAIAARQKPDVNMNPLILKYSAGKLGVKLVVKGKALEDPINAYNFREMKSKLLPDIMEAYHKLGEKHEIIVIEGAGSPVELNLNSDDIVNMGMAKRAKTPVLLVADIDRGGVFASLYGTVMLLDDSERALVKALIVNRFKGMLSHFQDGIKILEDITGKKVAAVVPHIDFKLPEEDSASLGAFEGSLKTESNKIGSDKIGSDIEKQIATVAEHVRKALDLDFIYDIIQKGNEQ